MSIKDEREFWDMCPHRIHVARILGRNNEGRPVVEQGSGRTYRCLIDVSTTFTAGPQGEQTTVSANAHVLPTPLEKEAQDEQVEIMVEESVIFLNPTGMEKRPMRSVEKFYDETGSLHNMVIHFS